MRDTSQYKAPINLVTVILGLHIMCTTRTPKSDRLLGMREKKWGSGEVFQK